MAMGSAGVSGDKAVVEVESKGFAKMMELLNLVGDPAFARATLRELADRETAIDVKLEALGGLEHAKELLAEALRVEIDARSHASDIVNDATITAAGIMERIAMDKREFDTFRGKTADALDIRAARITDLERQLADKAKITDRLVTDAHEKNNLASIAVRQAVELKAELEQKLVAIRKIAG